MSAGAELTWRVLGLWLPLINLFAWSWFAIQGLQPIWLCVLAIAWAAYQLGRASNKDQREEGRDG
jgi:hypothetical protein